MTGELVRLAELAHEAADRAAVAIANADLTAAYEVLALEEQLQEGHGACENRAVILLALEAPVARDLRQVVSALQIADDLSQLSWLLGRIADTAVQHYPHPVAPPALLPILTSIAHTVTAITAATVRAIAADTSPPLPIDPDPTLREHHDRVLKTVSAPDWPLDSAAAVDIALLVHHYERCAEHCLRIGRRMTFFHTGVPLSEQTPEEGASESG